MSLVRTVDQVEYPESDGRPMGETDLHIEWVIRIRDILRYRHQGQRVYVGANLLIYYAEGEPSKYVAPDVFVVQGCDPGRRRTFKIWEEGKVPAVVFEVTSRSTRREDAAYKPQIYAQMGVHEYFLYDPSAEYLDPPLQGLRLDGGSYAPIEASEAGVLKCAELDMLLELEQRELVLVDARTGQLLMTRAEAADAARRAAESARDAAEDRAARLEAELERLKQELERRRRTP